MVFGGHISYSYKNQISVVESYQLRRIGQLPIDFRYGACNTFLSNDQKDEIILCFAAKLLLLRIPRGVTGNILYFNHFD